MIFKALSSTVLIFYFIFDFQLFSLSLFTPKFYPKFYVRACYSFIWIQFLILSSLKLKMLPYFICFHLFWFISIYFYFSLLSLSQTQNYTYPQDISFCPFWQDIRTILTHRICTHSYFIILVQNDLNPSSQYLQDIDIIITRRILAPHFPHCNDISFISSSFYFEEFSSYGLNANTSFIYLFTLSLQC